MLLTLSGFLTGLLRGLGLLGLALAVGGVVWGLVVLRAPRRGDLPSRIVRRCLDLVGLGAVSLALAQKATLLLEIYVLEATLGRSPLAELLATPHFLAGIARTVLALALAVFVVRVRASPRAVGGWLIVGALAGLLATSGAWLTHAAGRLEHREGLMILTVAHQLGAAVWVGGLLQLGALWRLAQRDARVAAAWPGLVRRFSGLAAASVGALVLSAVPLAWTYTASWQGLAGTGYGSLVVTKAALLVTVLALAFVNHRTVRASDVSDGSPALRRRADGQTVADLPRGKGGERRPTSKRGRSTSGRPYAGSGKSTVIIVPSPIPALSARMTPPCNSTRWRAMLSPRPRPPCVRVVPASAWRKASKM